MFGFECRKWGRFFENGGGVLQSTPSFFEKHSPSSKNFLIFDVPPSSLFDAENRITPHLRSSKPNIEEPPIYNFRSSAPKIEEPPHLRFTVPENGSNVERKMGGFFENRGSSIFRVRETKNPPSSTFSARRTKNLPSSTSRPEERRTPHHRLLPTPPLTYGHQLLSAILRCGFSRRSSTLSKSVRRS